VLQSILETLNELFYYQMDSVYRTNVFGLCFLRFMDLYVKKTSSLIQAIHVKQNYQIKMVTSVLR